MTCTAGRPRGFVPGAGNRAPPADDTVTDVLERVGQDHLRLEAAGLSPAEDPSGHAGFFSIAKGASGLTVLPSGCSRAGRGALPG